MSKMSPELLLKYAILELALLYEGQHISKQLNGEQVEELWDETDCSCAKDEIRTSGYETGLPAASSRHYECEAVAVGAPNGQWVGFTYWHGGGKHGNPEEIDWIEHAYHVECVEEEKLVTVRTFSVRNETHTE